MSCPVLNLWSTKASRLDTGQPESTISQTFFPKPSQAALWPWRWCIGWSLLFVWNPRILCVAKETSTCCPYPNRPALNTERKGSCKWKTSAGYCYLNNYRSLPQWNGIVNKWINEWIMDRLIDKWTSEKINEWVNYMFLCRWKRRRGPRVCLWIRGLGIHKAKPSQAKQTRVRGITSVCELHNGEVYFSGGLTSFK